MTITIAWIRKNKNTTELILASDSRLRSYGAFDQSQKILRVERGDFCLGFSGDAQIAYPLFMQVGSALNNNIGTRSRAKDITEVAGFIQKILNNFIQNWDLPHDEKQRELTSTKIMLAGWSWKYQRFEIGVFSLKDGAFDLCHPTTRLPHPWRERTRSLTFIGDYEQEFKDELARILKERHGDPLLLPKYFDFEYEPIEALNNLLRANSSSHPLIGGAPQMVKVYRFGNSLPIVVRIETSKHFLLGRSLFEWEKTEHPIIDLTGKPVSFVYPLSFIPLPNDMNQGDDQDENDYEVAREALESTEADISQKPEL